MRKTSILIAALTAMVAACTSNGSEPDPTGLLGNRTGDSAILVVTHEGGFVPLEFNLTNLPAFVLTADRTLYAQGPIPEIFPGPMVRPMAAVTISEEDFTAILTYLDDLEIVSIDNERIDDGSDMIADAADTVFTYHDVDSNSHVLAVYALGIGTQTNNTRVLLAQSLMERLDGAYAGGTPSSGHEVNDLVVWASPAMAAEPDFVDIRPWPLPVAYAALPAGVAEWRCVEFAGAEGAGLLDTFQQATQVTQWVQDATNYSLIVKVRLPGDNGCRVFE